ncbi:endonuclease [Rubrivirga sp.]|uniref:endonuclease n=1 Tax=Rubrivirga sp. TaxID=1885344 RepID=UPI003B51BC47
MRFASLLVLLLLPASAAGAQTQTTLYPGLSGAELRAAIRADFAPALTLGYGPARDQLYTYEQAATGEVCGVYTRFCIELSPDADPSSDAYSKGINAEHTWPQSKGAGSEPARSDLHNLFPAKSNVNSSRGNHPFAEIPDALTDRWYREDQTSTTRPAVGAVGWSEIDYDNPAPGFSARFEPRHDHKGNAARAAFYFATIYAAQVAANDGDPFLATMLDDLVDWHYADPVDAREAARSEWIASKQGTQNPFTLDSTLARRAFDQLSTDPDPDPDPTPGGVIWVNEFHYDNAGSDAGEGVEVAGPAGTVLDGWTVVGYNGNGGGAYATVALSGTVPSQQGGFGTVWTPVPGLQNGSPDGIALVGPDGVVAQFLSYEGVVVAADGPAAGLTSVDVGVAESGTTPEGHSLRLVGDGSSAGDFAWTGPGPGSPGQPNPGQTFLPPPAAGVAWINEFHYDNRRVDLDEGVEVAGTPGLSLDGWTVALYGRDGDVYHTAALSGTIDDEGGLGAVWFDQPAMRNLGPAGLALVDAGGTTVEFLSYEGTITATAGPAAGLTSADVGLVEDNSTPYTRSIQRLGRGTTAADFTWRGPRLHSRGSLNASQSVPPSVAAAVGPAASSQVADVVDVALYPNPTSGPATVALLLDAPAKVTAEVVDVLGRRVALVEAGERAVGVVQVDLDLARVPAGVYLVRLTAGDRAVVRSLTVAR